MPEKKYEMAELAVKEKKIPHSSLNSDKARPLAGETCSAKGFFKNKNALKLGSPFFREYVFVFWEEEKTAAVQESSKRNLVFFFLTSKQQQKKNPGIIDSCLGSI